MCGRTARGTSASASLITSTCISARTRLRDRRTRHAGPARGHLHDTRPRSPRIGLAAPLPHGFWSAWKSDLELAMTPGEAEFLNPRNPALARAGNRTISSSSPRSLTARTHAVAATSAIGPGSACRRWRVSSDSRDSRRGRRRLRGCVPVEAGRRLGATRSCRWTIDTGFALRPTGVHAGETGPERRGIEPFPRSRAKPVGISACREGFPHGSLDTVGVEHVASCRLRFRHPFPAARVMGGLADIRPRPRRRAAWRCRNRGAASRIGRSLRFTVSWRRRWRRNAAGMTTAPSDRHGRATRLMPRTLTAATRRLRDEGMATTRPPPDSLEFAQAAIGHGPGGRAPCGSPR